MDLALQATIFGTVLLFTVIKLITVIIHDDEDEEQMNFYLSGMVMSANLALLLYLTWPF